MYRWCSRIFSAEDSTLLFYYEAKSLSRGKCLQRVLQLRNVAIFLEKEGAKFRDGLFVLFGRHIRKIKYVP